MRSGKVRADLLNTLLHVPKYPYFCLPGAQRLPISKRCTSNNHDQTFKKSLSTGKQIHGRHDVLTFLPPLDNLIWYVSNVLVWFDETDTLTLSLHLKIVCLFVPEQLCLSKQAKKETNLWPQHLISASNTSQLLLPCLLKGTYILLCKTLYVPTLISILCCR